MNIKKIAKEVYERICIAANDIRMTGIANQYATILTAKESIEYVKQLKELTVVQDFRGGGYRRIGRHNDGGYVMHNCFRDGCICYSFGINDDVSWDSFFAKRNHPVYMYDHTIEKLPYENSNFIWEKIGICGEKSGSYDGCLLTLEDILKKNGHQNYEGMILKMDVEGAEWNVFSKINPNILKCFDQIVLEMHGLWNLSMREKILETFRRLNRFHQLVHIHGSNGSFVIESGSRNIPNIIEMTYINRKGRKFIKSSRFFPTQIDEKNNGILPEIVLGFWNE